MIPPSKKMVIEPITKSIGVGNEIFPRHNVATQLKNLTPVGTATRSVLYMNGTRRYEAIPEVNMWCAQTKKPINAIPIDESATKR